MSKNSKILLGIFTFLPFLFGIALLVYYVSIVTSLMATMDIAGDQQEFMRLYLSKVFSWQIWALAAGSLATHLALMTYYIIHVVKNEQKSDGLKVVWVLLFIFIGTIPFVIYFFTRVVKDQPVDSAMERA